MGPASSEAKVRQLPTIAVSRTDDHLLAHAAAGALDVRVWSRRRALADVVALCLASSAAVLEAPPVRSTAENLWLAGAFPLVVIGILLGRHGPDERLPGSKLDIWTHVLGIVSLAAMLMTSARSILGGAHPVGLELRLWLASFVFLGVSRTALLSVRRQAVRNPTLATPTLIVGAGAVGEQLADRLLADPSYGLRPVAFLDADPLPRSEQSLDPHVPILGGRNDLVDAVRLTGARHVIVAFSTDPDDALVEKINECQQLGIEVSLVPRLFESVNERATLHHVGGVPLVSLHPTNPRGWEFNIKHALDRVFALVVLTALAPVLIAIGIAIRLTSPGPALFRQRRVGRDGRVFDLVKFRTMRETDCEYEFVPPDGCAPGGIEGPDRCTPLGRWLRQTSLDELPQFINVLRGEMSVVGPRPERPEFVERFTAQIGRYPSRHRVKSGITGWAQVNGLRGQTSIADRVEWDNYYIRNWSLGLELRIIVLTIGEIFKWRG